MRITHYHRIDARWVRSIENVDECERCGGHAYVNAVKIGLPAGHPLLAGAVEFKKMPPELTCVSDYEQTGGSYDAVCEDCWCAAEKTGDYEIRWSSLEAEYECLNCRDDILEADSDRCPNCGSTRVARKDGEDAEEPRRPERPLELNGYPVRRWYEDTRDHEAVALVERDNAPFAGKPFATWSVFWRDECGWCCEHGHYDLDAKEARADFANRAGRLMGRLPEMSR